MAVSEVDQSGEGLAVCRDQLSEMFLCHADSGETSGMMPLYSDLELLPKSLVEVRIPL